GTHRPARRLRPAAAHRRAGGLRARRFGAGHGVLHGPAAGGGVPAARLRHERVLHAGDPVLHLRRRLDDARRHRGPAGGAGRRHGGAPARGLGAGEHRGRDPVRRRVRLGGCGRLGGWRRDDPADEGARLRAGLRGEPDGQRGADRPPDPAEPQHDPLRDRRRGGDQRGGPVHRGPHARPPADAGADGGGMAGGHPPRLPARALPGLGCAAPAARRFATRPHADRHHLRRRTLRRLHRDRERLRRRALRRAGHHRGVPRHDVGRLHRGGGWGHAHDRHGHADHRHRHVLRLVDGPAPSAGADGGADARHHRGPAADPAADQRDPAAARHLHGHGPAHHDRHADLPAGGQGAGDGPGPLRHHADPEPRHRHHHAAGGAGAVRGLRGGQGLDVGGDEVQPALLRRLPGRAAAGHLRPGAVALAAIAVPL
ncbi:MAG: TRAP-type C4-dicarboxylate transport system, large permease component, partial [uncultured Acetobacteraceae bacterium]